MYSYDLISGGPWRTFFGETTSQVESRLRAVNPNFNLEILPGQQINIWSPVMIAGEVFSSGSYGFRNNTFVFCMFQKAIRYDGGFTHPLNASQAEEWLRAKRNQVDQIIAGLNQVLSSRYGMPLKSTENEITWRDNNGNMIKIEIDKVLNIAEKDPEATRLYGWMPLYGISLAYIAAPIIPNY